ncbi:MAG TPA: hypothetical protein HA367_03845 [Candidatus Methanofastidiosum sp.]|jgi:hypothetical protein|nr:hypothetical protein [Methanofastidiosum sp.]
MHALYYVIKSEYHANKGERYFKFDPAKNSVLQIIVSTGEKKTGRPNLKGTYLTSRMAFLGNYIQYDYVKPITEDAFYKQLDKMYKKLLKF